MRILTRLLAAASLFVLGHAFAQTYVKVANEGDTVTFSGPASVRYGAAQGAAATASYQPCAKVGGCWNLLSVSGTAPMTIANGGAFGTDPIVGTVKELDVLQTNAVQNLIVNGKPVTVAALPVVVVTPPVKTVIGTFMCKVVEYSDMTFTTTNADCAVAK